MLEETLSDRLRGIVSVVITPTGRFLNSLGISPDVITFVGLAVVALGSWRLSEGDWTSAVIILALGLPLDMLDGATARAYGKFRPFGSFLDSTLDRYADGLIFGAIALYFARIDDYLMTMIAISALHGTLMVSYIRAKAESLNVECKVGLFSRVERLLVLLATWFGWIAFGDDAIGVGIVILALGTQYTALQRMYHVSRQLHLKAKLEGKLES
jgi:CDP-diacylglycerol--glycerol-3-phosphate 3-phosphatidyltransferase